MKIIWRLFSFFGISMLSSRPTFTGSSPRIPGLDKITPPQNSLSKWREERSYIMYVLEAPDDLGIERHKPEIQQVLDKILPTWKALVEDQDITKETINSVPTKKIAQLKTHTLRGQSVNMSSVLERNYRSVVEEPSYSQPLKGWEALLRVKDAKPKQSSSYDFTIEELYEGSSSLQADDNQLFSLLSLHRFYVLKLDIDYPVLEQTLGHQTDALLQELKYSLQKETNLKKVTADIYIEGRMGSDSNVPNIEDVPHDWHLTSMRAQRASSNGVNAHIPATARGQGVVLAHPDTGYTNHSELNTDPLNNKSPNINYQKQFNVFTMGNDAEESLAEGLDKLGEGQLPGLHDHHGTAILSAIISRHRTSITDREDVKGIAPDVEVMPIRCVTSVILFSGVNVARAIWYAVNNGADVINLSLGGIGSKFFQAILKYAEFNDVICVAAAGNVVPFVFAPGIYPETVCMAGINANEKPWKDTAQGCAVDLAAPASEVNRGAWQIDEATQQSTEITGPSAGTSYATAHCAGTAALWLQTHNKSMLQTRLSGRASLLTYYKAHLKSTARIPEHWDTQRMGAGLLDVQGMLDPSTLPDPTRFNNPIKIDPTFMTSIDVIAKQLCPVISRQEALKIIEDVLGEEARNRIEEFGEEIEAIFTKFDEVKDAFINGLRERTKAFIDEVKARLRALLASAQETAKQAIIEALTALENLKDEVEKGVQDALSLMDQKLSEIEEMVEAVLIQLNETFAHIVEQAGAVVEQAKDWFEDLYETIIDFTADESGGVIAR